MEEAEGGLWQAFVYPPGSRGKYNKKLPVGKYPSRLQAAVARDVAVIWTRIRNSCECRAQLFALAAAALRWLRRAAARLWGCF